MSITDVAHRLILTVISLIAFMTSKILMERDVSPGNAESLTICKETHQGEFYERIVFYHSSKWHVYQKGRYAGFMTVFPASESNCVDLYVSKSLRFFGKILGVLGLVCSRHYVPWRTITIYEQPRYPPRVPGMRLIKYAPLFPRLASQLPWSSRHLENVSSVCKDTLRRREYVEVLAKSIIRRKVKESQLGHGSISPSYHPVPSPNSQKAHDLRKALVKTLGASALKRESLVIKEKEAPHTPKEIRLERRMRLALGENLSIKNLASAAIARKAPASPLPDRSPSRIHSLQPKTRYRNQKSSRHSLHEAAATSFTLFVNLGPDSEDAVPGSNVHSL
ncbi:uncharacterized protein HD556DRAFT_1384966 [Suillus plorans]|uniref:Uncharacterized protein n=1 Tax=Suillus plorans TaxID=116603 RepID=A0A9P7DB88_9AGAM|nr:uncharacterized protein HD556DRAFT_1416338 [Suillus plorans]XP_041158339.1 uncharacterized protein HD556DRAFT_1384966 [Suillus plorans]KAG1786322.1 hypothetical protein HD556DRAFT_1416338 [Suillus plorans]KAG1791533.1 hypothetical protein HD556DRAFT_1384966 [Suillus plorans]